MNGVIGQVQEEWLSLLSTKNADRLGGEPVCQILAFGTVAEMRDVPQSAERPVTAVRKEEGLRSTPQSSADVVVETLRLWVVLCRAEVPLSNMRRGIARPPEHLRDRDLAVRQAVPSDRGKKSALQRRVLCGLAPHGHVQLRRMLPSKDGRPGGSADG